MISSISSATRARKDTRAERRPRLRRSTSGHVLTLTVVIGAVVTVGCPHAPRLGWGPEIDTWSEIRVVARDVEAFRLSHHRLPRDLRELCPQDHQDCGSRRDDPLTDGWGAPISYQVVAGEYELRSNGADGHPHTVDDLVFTPSMNQAQARHRAGCYRIGRVEWPALHSDTLTLDTTAVSYEGYVTPDRKVIIPWWGLYRLLPRVNGYAGIWAPLGPDSVLIGWGNGPHITEIVAQVQGDSLLGILRAAGDIGSTREQPVSAIRIDCAPNRS